MLKLICINRFIIFNESSTDVLQVCKVPKLWEWRVREGDSISISLFDVINQKA